MAQNTTVAASAEEAAGAPFPMTVDELLELSDDGEWQSKWWTGGCTDDGERL